VLSVADRRPAEAKQDWKLAGTAPREVGSFSLPLFQRRSIPFFSPEAGRAFEQTIRRRRRKRSFLTNAGTHAAVARRGLFSSPA